jgi:ubiquinone/menaquinone biosynthesis C-methylase UbiE
LTGSRRSAETAVGAGVRRFYEAHPFPGFDASRFTTREELRIRASWFATQLDRDLPIGIRLADVGCGTGRLAALLSLRSRFAVGIDFSRRSLGHARRLQEALGLENVSYVEADLFQMPLRAGSFHVVLALGVLHHTADPGAGLAAVTRLARPGGLLIVGFYHRLGRLAQRIRQRLAARAGIPDNVNVLKRRLRGQLPDLEELEDLEKLKSWYHDQYLHPHELTVSLRQLKAWFAALGVAPLGSFPALTMITARGKPGSWLREESRGDGGERLRGMHARLVELKWMITLRRAGGYFVQAGRVGGGGEADRCARQPAGGAF